MMLFIMISVSVGLLAYVAMSMLDERMMARRRVSLAIGERARNIAQVGFDRAKLVSKVAQQQQERTAKRPSLSVLIERAGLKLSPLRLQLIMLAVSFMVGVGLLVMFKSWLIAGFVSTFIFLVVTRLFLAFMIGRRQAAFLAEFPDALDMISRGLKAGMPLASSLKQIVDSVGEPIRSEFAHVLDLQKIGMPLGEAVKKMPDRIDLLDLRFFTIVIEIQQKSGGNLAEIIQNISFVIRGRKEMRAKINALVAEAKVSAIIIGGIPILFGLLSWNSDPEGFSKFWTETVGQVLMGFSIVLYISGMSIFIYLAKPKI